MYITKELLKKIDLRNEISPRTHPSPYEVSQATIRRNDDPVSFHYPKVKQKEHEKLSFSSETF